MTHANKHVQQQHATKDVTVLPDAPSLVAHPSLVQFGDGQLPSAKCVVCMYLLSPKRFESFRESIYLTHRKGVPACKAVPEVEGGWSGQAAENFFWEAQILCVFSPISA